jgi:hypothetical protein
MRGFQQVRHLMNNNVPWFEAKTKALNDWQKAAGHSGTPLIDASALEHAKV